MSEEGTERLLSDCVGCRILRAELTEARREYEGPMAEEIAEAHAAIRAFKRWGLQWEPINQGYSCALCSNFGRGEDFQHQLSCPFNEYAPVIRRAMGEK